MKVVAIIVGGIVLLVAGVYMLGWLLDRWLTAYEEDEDEDDFGDTDDWNK